MTFTDYLRKRVADVNRESFAYVCAVIAACLVGTEIVIFVLSLLLGDTLIAIMLLPILLVVAGVTTLVCTLTFMFVNWILYERKL
jgi:uncharacterized membrane protein YhaH (DUF805 family)